MDYQKLSINELIKLCANYPPDERAWREFIRRFEEHIKFYALRELRNKISDREQKQLPEIVQDRVSEVYTKLVDKQHKALKNFIGLHDNAFYVYLATITRNIVINWVVREKKTQSRPNIEKSLDSDERADGSNLRLLIGHVGPEIEVEINIDHLKYKIEVILDSYLRGKQRDRNKLIFKLHFYEELTPDEILHALPRAMTLKTVQNIIANLKKIVRDGLSGGKFESI